MSGIVIKYDPFVTNTIYVRSKPEIGIILVVYASIAPAQIIGVENNNI
jgi:hypothetical protein